MERDPVAVAGAQEDRSIAIIIVISRRNGYFGVNASVIRSHVNHSRDNYDALISGLIRAEVFALLRCEHESL